MIQLSPNHITIKIESDQPREKIADLHSGLIEAIRGLTQPGPDPITPARSEAIHTHYRVIIGIPTKPQRTSLTRLGFCGGFVL